MCFMWEVLQKRNAKQFSIVLFYLPIFYEVVYALCKALYAINSVLNMIIGIVAWQIYEKCHVM